MTVYLPLYRGPRPANVITVPSGKTFGSPATTPLLTLVPTAVVLPVQYAVIVKETGLASGPSRRVGCRGRGVRAQPWVISRAAIATLHANDSGRMPLPRRAIICTDFIGLLTLGCGQADAAKELMTNRTESLRG